MMWPFKKKKRYTVRRKEGDVVKAAIVMAHECQTYCAPFESYQHTVRIKVDDEDLESQKYRVLVQRV